MDANRRRLISSLAAPLLPAGGGMGDRAKPVMNATTMRYGADANQAGDLYLPTATRPPVVCLLHGGFWREPYGRDQLEPVARDLCGRGYAAWNIGYRRLGPPGIGWSEIEADVASAIEFLAQAAERTPLDLDRVAVVGHSAGGQLALACTSSSARRAGTRKVKAEMVASLAGLNDLEEAFALDLGRGAVRALMGGSPSTRAVDYARASPLHLLPHGARIVLLHGVADDAVPISQSARFAEAARKAGDRVTCARLEGQGHMDFLDPGSPAHRRLCEALRSA
jgi:acetyl esterase/lipase